MLIHFHVAEQAQLKEDFLTLPPQHQAMVQAICAHENADVCEQEGKTVYLSFDTLKAHTLRELQAFFHWVKTSSDTEVGTWQKIPLTYQ